MPGPRLLIVADQKMLPALANGLRDSGKFEISTAALSDAAAAQTAAEQAEAIAIFYGAPGAPLGNALQKLSPKVRERGGRVVAVLQREQAGVRDDCFRNGASDLIFMPLPKDQFVARLAASVEMAFPQQDGLTAAVAVATRTAASKLDGAKVSAVGVEAAGPLSVKAGETVRLSWSGFQHWGLVVRAAPAQVRFAGLAPDEEEKVRSWLKGEASKPAPAAPKPPSPPSAETPAVPPDAAATPAPALAPPVPPPAAAAPSSPPPTPGGRAAPASGPPPGFADRKPVRPQTQTRPPPRIPPPVMAGSGAAAPAAAPAATPPPAAVAPPPAAVPPPPPAPNGSAPSALSGLFEDSGPPRPGSDAAVAAAVAPGGPPWPVPAPLATCKTVATQLLKDKTLPADAPLALLASARKITGMLSSSERTALDKAGPESHFTEALATRIALDTATSEALKLFATTPAPSFDQAAAASLIKLADEAAAHLQKEANTAIGKGEVENLQLLTAASAALSRDLLNFKETADRLRGIAAAPRLGAGALDPEVVLPGQAPRPKPVPGQAMPAPVKAELRDFQGLDQRAGRGKPIIAALLIAGAVAAAVNGFYFGLPHHKELAVAEAGEGIIRIDIAGEAAMVTVSPDWAAHSNAKAYPLAVLLREHGAKKAIIILPNGRTIGVLNTANGQLVNQPPKRK